MGKILYVGSLSVEATEQDLKALFSRVGQVQSVSIVTDRMNGQPRGYAFVEMSTEAEAQAAIESLNGEEVSGRKIRIQERTGSGIRDRSRGRR